MRQGALLRSRVMRHFFTRKRAWVPALALALTLALSAALGQTAGAVTFHTMRPSANTAYCVADLLGAGGNVTLVNPCNLGNVEAWGVSLSSYGGGLMYYQIQNQSDGTCLQTNGYEHVLNVASCNGDEAQAWEQLGQGYNGHPGTIWRSAYFVNGSYLCADASVSAGVRAWPCNSSGAQNWQGPE